MGDAGARALDGWRFWFLVLFSIFGVLFLLLLLWRSQFPIFPTLGVEWTF